MAMEEDSSRLSTVTPEMSLMGYLYKKTRNETWQRRYFRTQGFYLTYYKNRKQEKLLAALSLPQVGKIHLLDGAVDGQNAEGGTFALELNTRVYILRANDKDTALVWVSTLLRLREQGLAATGETTNPVNKTGGVDGGEGGEAPQLDDWLKTKKSGPCPCFGGEN